MDGARAGGRVVQECAGSAGRPKLFARSSSASPPRSTAAAGALRLSYRSDNGLPQAVSLFLLLRWLCCVAGSSALLAACVNALVVQRILLLRCGSILQIQAALLTLDCCGVPRLQVKPMIAQQGRGVTSVSRMTWDHGQTWKMCAFLTAVRS